MSEINESDCMNLSLASSEIVDSIIESLELLEDASIFDSREIAERYNSMTRNFKKLESVFPNVAHDALKYYTLDFPNEVSFDSEAGYLPSLFFTFLAYYKLKDAVTLSKISESIAELSNYLYMLYSFTNDQDAENNS